MAPSPPPPPPPQTKEQRLSGTRVLKACDACKARKVRCSGNPGPCTRCLERKTTCHFSRMQVPKRQKVATQLLIIEPPKPSVSAPPEDKTPPRVDGLAESYVDRLLANARSDVGPKDQPFSFKGNGLFLTSVSYGLTFFSDSRLQSLSARLRNNKLYDLTRRISVVLQNRAKPTDVSAGTLSRRRENAGALYDAAKAAKWVTIYFERIHPIYPFLDRASFEAATRDKGFDETLRTSRAWFILYHSVISLGCQHDGGGSFDPATGLAWRIFTTALAQWPELLVVPDSLLTVQALTAMAIYTSGISCLSIEHPVLSEAARRVQRLVRTPNLAGAAADAAYRAFWVLYSMEKVSSFYMGRTSLFVDHDISCPVPRVRDALVGDLDWFLTYARHARLRSRALTALFSSGVIGNPPAYFLDTIDQLNAELEAWRASIPPDTRPGQTLQPHKLHAMLQGDATRQVILWTHYLYSGFRMVMARATLQLAVSIDGLVPAAQQAGCKALVMEESRTILEMTKYIDAEPWAPLWIIAGVPVIALFTLFELVIFNPKHHETRGNLALLDVAAGYFSRLEYASNGSMPSSLVSEFAYIAREYVNNVTKQQQQQQPSSASSSLSTTAAGGNGNGGGGGGSSTTNTNAASQHRHGRRPSVPGSGVAPSSLAVPEDTTTTTSSHSQPTTPLSQQHHHHQQQQQQSLVNIPDGTMVPSLLSTTTTTTTPQTTTFLPAPPQMQDDPSALVEIDSSPSSVSIDGINIPMGDAIFGNIGVGIGSGIGGGMGGIGSGSGSGMDNDFLLGTDVMDLFNYAVPGIDPFYTQLFDVQDHQMGG